MVIKLVRKQPIEFIFLDSYVAKSCVNENEIYQVAVCRLYGCVSRFKFQLATPPKLITTVQ